MIPSAFAHMMPTPATAQAATNIAFPQPTAATNVLGRMPPMASDPAFGLRRVGYPMQGFNFSAFGPSSFQLQNMFGGRGGYLPGWGMQKMMPFGMPLGMPQGAPRIQ